MPKSDVFIGKLTDEELGIVEDSLEMSKSFKVYGDGREIHQKKIDRIIMKLYTAFWEK